MSVVNVDRLVKVYIKIRDEKERVNKEAKDAVAVLDKQMEKIEAQMLAYSIESGVASFKTPFGTCYKKQSEKASVADWNSLEAWMLKNQDLSMVEHRVKVTAVREYAEDHDGSLPPGVNVFKEEKMYFNRPAK